MTKSTGDKPSRMKKKILFTVLIILVALMIAISGTRATLSSGTGGDAQLAVNVEDVGVVVNSDASAKANTAILKKLFLNSIDPIFLPEGEISFSDTLVMGVGVKVFATPKTVLKLLTNVTGIVVNDITVIEDLTLRLPKGYTQTGLYLDGTKRINTCKGRNIRIEGTSGYTGTAIRATAMGDTDYVCFVDYENIYIKNVDTAITFEDNQTVPAVYPCGWINGNRFNNVSIIANNGIRLMGNPSGNEFNIQFQAIPSTVNAIYCEGSQNYISGFVWDMVSGMNATFTRESRENILAIPPANIDSTLIKDEGIDNIFPYDNQKGYQLRALNTRANLTIFADEFRKNNPNFFGVQDNCLAFIDKRGATVTVSGNIAVNPGVSTLFNSRYTGAEYRFKDPGITPAVIEIDTSSSNIDNMYMIGMSFSDGKAAADYTIELVTTPGGAYYPWVEVTGNRSSTVLHEFDPYGVKVYKVKITITKAIYNPTVNPDRQVRLAQIYGANAGLHAGSPFLFGDGDTMYGDMEFSSSAEGVILRSPNGSRYRLTVDDSGALSAVLVK